MSGCGVCVRTCLRYLFLWVLTASLSFLGRLSSTVQFVNSETGPVVGGHQRCLRAQCLLTPPQHPGPIPVPGTGSTALRTARPASGIDPRACW